jgi:hypothetical protein
MTGQRPTPRRPFLLGAGVLLSAWVSVSPVSALQAEPVLVLTRAHDPLVAVTVRFPTGSASDPQGREGAAFLLGRVLEAESQAGLAPLSSRLEVSVARNEFLLSLRAPPSEWDRAWGVVQRALTAPPLTEGSLARIRASHQERLLFETGAPVRRFELERDRLILGATDPGSREASGTSAGVAQLTAEDLNEFRRAHLDLSRTNIAVVGPPTAAQVQGVLRAPTLVFGDEGNALSPAPTLPSPLRAPLTPSAPQAWTLGDRLMIDQDVTSTWLSVAWPLPAGTPPLLLDFLSHVVEESLNPIPPDPGLYRAEARIERIGESPILIASVTLDPRIARRWEERVVDALAALAESAPEGAFFELSRRRYRARRLLEWVHPEAKATWLARTQAAHQEVSEFHSQIWALTREGLQDLARARGEPRVLLLGPARMMGPE